MGILLCIVVYICYIVVYCCVLHSSPLLLVTLLTGLAQFGSGRYWVVSECCLDILEGVWKEYQMCLESACKVSGSCQKDFLSQKLTNVKKKDFLGQKTKLGLSLSRKNGFFKQKVNQFSKKQKKSFWGKKRQKKKKKKKKKKS